MESKAFFNQFKSFNTIKNIKSNLKSRLESEYGLTGTKLNKAVNKALELNGLNINRFDVVTVVGNSLLSKLNANDSSINPNANKSLNTIKRCLNEAQNSSDKLVGMDFLYRKCKELYGREEACKLMGKIYDFTLYLHDPTQILVPYCYALNGSELVAFGRNYGDVKCDPAQHLHSYISMLCGTVHTVASNIAGAVAVGSFFIDSCAALLKENIKLKDIKKQSFIKSNWLKFLSILGAPKYNHRKYVENMFQQFIYDVRDLTRAGCESPFTNISIFDHIKLKNLIQDSWFLFSELNVSEDYVVEMTMELQRIFMELFDKGDPAKGGLQFNFPVTTVNFSINEESRELLDSKFLDEFCTHKVNRYNIFVSGGTKIASCCRLINDTEFLELASQSNSFGGGSSSNIGSHRVVTINLPRIAYQSKDLKDFISRVEPLIYDVVKILKAHMVLLQELTDADLQPVISAGLVRLDRLFSTLGLIGIYEAGEILKEKSNDNETDIIEIILKFINKVYIAEGMKAGLKPNIEGVPGESLAEKFCQIDNFIFGLDKYQLYSNQYIPLWEEASIYERLDIDGRYNLLLTGGAIAHAQIESVPTPRQSKQMILHAAKCGCEHFALNMIATECSNGHVTDCKYDKCPICGDTNLDYYTRVVGFLTKVKNWVKTRRDWEFPRRKFSKIK